MIISAYNMATVLADLYWSNTVLLLKDIGINGATNNSFYDDGPYKFLPTRNGDVTQGTFSPFGALSGTADPTAVGGSVYFDGTGDYLTIPDNTALQMGTGNFTYEFWWFPTSFAGYQTLFSKGGNQAGSIIMQTETGTGKTLVASGGSYIISTTSAAATLNTWSHVALVRSGTTLTVYLNGASVGSGTLSSNLNNTSVMAIGIDNLQGLYPIQGYISNFRAVKGSAVYTANFAPPTAPLTAISGTSLLTCQSDTTITDASTNNFTVSKVGDARANPATPFGYGSAYFDGAGDYLTLPSSTAVAFGTADFTVEFWGYANSHGKFFVSGYDGSASWDGINIGTNSSTAMWWLFGGLGTSAWVFERSPSFSLSLNTWHHFAVTRESGVAKLWVDGSLVDSVANTTNFVATKWYVGGAGAAGYGTNGYVSNLRVVKGSAVYTAPFTPPTAPLTAISGTSLLTCQDKGSIVDASTNSFTVTRVGDAKPVGMTPFAQKNQYWSASFDGSGDYLTIPYTASKFDWWSTDYTIEAWVFAPSWSTWSYLDYTGGNPCLIGNNDAGTTTNYWSFGPLSDGRVGLYYYGGAGAQGIYSTQTLNSGQWNHIAMTTKSGNVTIYVNGVASSPASYLGTPASNASYPLTIGGGRGTYINGYVSNLRVVKGSAVYSGNFTPPTAPLSAVAGTSLLAFQDNRFRDNSGNSLALTRYGDTAVSRLNPFGSSGVVATTNLASAGSVYFDGSGDCLTTPSNASANGSSDFTIECWYNNAVSHSSALFGQGNSSQSYAFMLQVLGNDLYFYSGGGGVLSGTGVGANPGRWRHLAIVKYGSTSTMYVDGVSVATGSFSYGAGNNSMTIGSNDPSLGMGSFNGNISNFRIVNGTAVYTSNFTPSTSPLTAISGTSLLTAQDAVNVTDASSNAFTVTKVGNAKAVEASPFKRVTYPYAGSGYFDGVGDRLTIPSNPGWAFGTGDYCIEMWVNPQSWPSTSYAPLIRTIGGTQGFVICNNGGNLLYHIPNSGDKLSAALPPLGMWSHIVVCRRGTTLSMFVNGVRVSSATNSNNQAAADLAIGGSTDWNSYVNAYISNIRIVKGSSVYDPSALSFTPPVEPVKAIGGTSLLLNFDNAGVYDSSGFSNAITNGTTTKTSSTVTKFGTEPTMYFSGAASSCVTIPDSIDLRMGTGDFTIECWFYPTAYALQVVWYRGAGTTGTNQAIILSSSGNNVQYNGGATISSTGSGAGAYLVNAWNHVAVSRTSGNTRLFLNGVQQGSTLSDTTDYNLTTPLTIGDRYPNHPYVNYPFTGYISDLRVSKGVARYTSNFSVPAASFPTTAG